MGRNSEKTEIKAGNKCVFMMFTLFNFLLFLSSLGILGCSIYLFAITKNGNTFNIVFLISSLFLLMLTTCAFKLRESIHLLGIYIFLQLVLFTFMLIFSLVLMFNVAYVTQWAEQKYNDAKAADPSIP